MLHISGCENGLKGGVPPTKKGEEKKKPFNPMQYRLQEAKAKQEKEKKEKLEKEAKRKAAREARERQPGDFRDMWGPTTANESWDVSSQSSMGSSMVAQRSEASSEAGNGSKAADLTSVASRDSSLIPPAGGFRYDMAYELGETEPQLSSLAVNPVVTQPRGKAPPASMAST